MATNLTQELTYQAPLDAVAAMLADPAFREEVCNNQRAVSCEVSVEGDTDTPRVRVAMTQATEGVPGFAKKFIGETTTIVQTEEWSSASSATVRMEIPGKPGDIQGTISLVESAGVTTQTVELAIKVKIPLIAGKIEDLLAKLLRSALRREHRTGEAWLKDH